MRVIGRAVVLMVFFWSWGVPGTPQAPQGVALAQDTPRTGGVLKVAIVGEPPSLDIPMTTATLTYELMWHVNESLFAYDKGFLPIPHLAESDVFSDRGLKHTITLRRGVKFHTGKEMIASRRSTTRTWGR
jgi:peptide/nickel transport system substrate-binding protein